MQSEQVGSLYKLYCLGWRQGSTRSLPLLLHQLLSIFFYYRRGFSQGTEWRQQQLMGELSQR